MFISYFFCIFAQMDIRRSFDNALKRMVERKWEKIYVLVDVHDTIFKASYHDEEKFEWFPYAKEALKIMSDAQQISLILWTSSYRRFIELYKAQLKKEGINIDMVNINEETENNDLSLFDEKTYFNVGIDDKFGFEAETDWKTIYEYLIDAIRMDKLR